MRTGVPVFEPSLALCHVFQEIADKPTDGGSPARPPERLISPMWIKPLIKVPEVMMTHLAKIDKALFGDERP